ncbi:PIG-L family deacetylase [Actinophytocola sp.]|uniref:PIG-L deacetylase family protein n=1 Tax=Actinophytocola sp. TaxID=1872138 RepID=UPI002ED5AA6D
MTARLVVSPHPDDAVWSLGGCLARWRHAGDPVTVLTVFDGPPSGPVAGWRQVAEPAVRHEENRRALTTVDVLGASVGLPDAALRTGDRGPRYPRLLSLFTRPNPDDAALPGAIAATIRAHLAPGAALYAPLAAGNHVDHQLVRAAVETDPVLRARATWYEDIPYRLGPRDTTGLHPRHEPVDLSAWLTAAACYESQADALLGGVPQLRATLTERAADHGGAVRLWT